MKAMITVVGTIVFALFFFILILGIVIPNPANVPSGNFLSDNWIHTPHPNLAVGCFITLVLILTPSPAKTISFWRKKTKN